MVVERLGQCASMKLLDRLFVRFDRSRTEWSVWILLCERELYDQGTISFWTASCRSRSSCRRSSAKGGGSTRSGGPRRCIGSAPR